MANNIIKRVWNQNRMVAIEDLKGMTFQDESGGHTFQISGADDAGNTVALSGSVSGVFLRPDNTDVAITGSASGGVVSVTLLPECYDVPGRFGLTVFVTDNGQKTAVYAAVGTVSRTSSGTVSPGTTSDVVDLINRINAAVATIPASWTGLMADIAPTYSASAVYPVGAYCYYDGDLYRCTTAITTAESWTAGHWTQAVLGQDVSDLKQAVNKIDNVLVVDVNGDKDGVPTTWSAKSIYYVTGNNSNSTQIVRTEKFSVDDFIGAVVPSPYSIFIFAYNGSDYLGAYNPIDKLYSNTSNPWNVWGISGYLDFSELKSARSTISGMESLLPETIIVCLDGATNQDLNEVSNLTFVPSDSERLKNIEEKIVGLPLNVVQTTGTSTTAVMSQKAITDAIDALRYIKPDRSITTNEPEAPYDDIHTLPINTIVAYYNSMANVANSPTKASGTVLTFSSGSTATICQLYFDRYGSVFCSVKWGSNQSEWYALRNPNIVQSPGSSITDVMSQKAVTDAINAIGAFPKSEYTTVSLFGTIGVIGDSFSSGGVLNDAGTGIVNNYALSWPQIMARNTGITAINYSSTGADIARFLTSSSSWASWNIDKLESDPARDLYLIVMGINSEKSLSDSTTEVGVGTVSDIDTSDYHNNADTFCGHYGQMLSRIIAHAPTSKIILVISSTNTEKETAVRNIAQLYQLPVFKMRDAPLYSTSFYTNNLQMGHPTVPVYAGMANAFAKQIAGCIVDNIEYFKNYRPQT